jgi:hypothetical protein
MGETVYTVTTAWNGDSADGSAQADVRVFATLEAARAYYDRERLNIHGRNWSGLWSTEAPYGPAPDEYPDHGWVLAYAAPGDEAGEGDPYAGDEVGMTLRAHPLLGAEVTA